MFYGETRSLSVGPHALYRKAKYAAANPGKVFHTVAIDRRLEFEDGAHAGKYSGHTYYYKRACGPYSLESMQECKSLKKLSNLINAKDEDLPVKARGEFPSGAKFTTLQVKAEADRLYNNGRDKVRRTKKREARENKRVRRSLSDYGR
ncbi:hypothetical protein [Singulisphaera acidiphila]|nr:hypothetical protein [Singulisphaera acidiphila]